MGIAASIAGALAACGNGFCALLCLFSLFSLFSLVSLAARGNACVP
jgi:hypothetical protein